MSDRFHRAARDGYLDLLQHATRKDCNSPDEDGMTPTILAASCGKLEALRLLTGRGGDPNKCNFFGTTALHASASNGHFNCVSFLVNFGVNLWALDNDQQTAKDVAGLMNHDEVLRFLDVEMTRQSGINRKTVGKLKEKAVKDYEDRVKKAEKLHKQALKQAQKEEERRKKIALAGGVGVANGESVSPGNSSSNSSGPYRRRSTAHGTTFSSITAPNGPAKNSNSNIIKSAVEAKVAAMRRNLANGGSVGVNSGDDFRVAAETDSAGKRSTRSISGLRKGSEVLMVPKYDTQGSAGNGSDPRNKTRMQDIFGGSTTGGRLNRATSEPYINFLPVGGDDSNDGSGALPSLFDRPQFGRLTFGQNSLSGALLAMTNEFANEHRRDDNDSGGGGSSIGSAGSLARRNGNGWMPYGIGDEQLTGDDAALETFLTAHGLRSCLHYLRLESVDLRALLLLNENELKELGIPLGYRKKLLEAIDRRKMALNEVGDVYDSRL